jgi:flagellar hook-associated protein 1
MLGTGVQIYNIERVRDQMADMNVRREVGRSAGFGVRYQTLTQIENAFGEPSENGIAARLDAFWSSWSDLSQQPGSGSARVLVLQRGQQLALSLNQAAERLDDLRDNLRVELEVSVRDLNDLAKQVAALNVEIVRMEAGGRTASDLRDTRDRLLDTMAGLGNTRVLERPDGNVMVLVDGVNLVDGSSHRALQLQATGNTVQVLAGGQPLQFPAEGSRLGEIVRQYNEVIPAAERELDRLAEALVTTVNAIHTTGWPPNTPDGTTAPDFFDASQPASFTARNIGVNQALVADHWLIAASTAAPGQNGTGDSTVAVQMASLRNGQVTIGGVNTTFAGHYRELVTGVALQVRAAENSRAVYDALAEQALTRRDSVSGVNIDEELVNLMQHQQAYTAATRVISAVDEMMQDLLRMV